MERGYSFGTCPGGVGLAYRAFLSHSSKDSKIAMQVAEALRVVGLGVEGLAVIAQNAGAGAVLATLWPVADASAEAWMAELNRWKSTAKQARALTAQRVQQASLRREVSRKSLPEAARGLKADAAEETHGPVGRLEGWRHLYYWAPFVLFGTGR